MNPTSIDYHGGSFKHQPRYRSGMGRPLCRTFELALFSSFSLEVRERNAATLQRWRWALGMLADGDCEVLGAWPATASHDLLLREHLRERGVERIGALLGDEALARVMEIPVAMQPLKESGIAAKAKAAQLHAKIQRAGARSSPFGNLDSVSACVGRLLEEAELADLARQRRRLQEQWRVARLQAPALAAGA